MTHAYSGSRSAVTYSLVSAMQMSWRTCIVGGTHPRRQALGSHGLALLLGSSDQHAGPARASSRLRISSTMACPCQQRAAVWRAAECGVLLPARIACHARIWGGLTGAHAPL